VALYRPIAINHSHDSENRIHSDDVARQYGFTGALVPGVAVFGHMTHPLSETFGEDWLGHSHVSLRLLKPAYHGDRLAIALEPTGVHSYQIECRNDSGVLLATLSANVGNELPPVDPRAAIPGAAEPALREPIQWDAIAVNEPFAAVDWQPTEAENRDFTEQIADDLPLYRAGVVHPHLIQHWCNAVLVRRFVLPAWIHVGTDMTFRRVLRVGDHVRIRSIPIEKWRHKGHEFIKLYVVFAIAGDAAVEALHTAIYKVAPKAA
jgi:acyl dehydratase